MANKNWQAGGRITIPATAAAGLLAIAVPLGAACASNSDDELALFTNAPEQIAWQMLLGGIVVSGFVVSVAVWVLSMLRRVERSRQRRNAFVSSGLNNLQP